MANTATPLPRHRASLYQRLAFIVGGICIIGFLIDILIIALPPNPLAPQWRLNFLQLVSERSLLLFIGSVLMLYSKLDGRLKQLRTISMVFLIVGLLLGLSSLMVIQDTLTLQRQAIANINTQAAELRARIEQGQEDPTLGQQISPHALSEALRSVESQTTTLTHEAQIGAMKTLISSAGNLLLMGTGLVGIGRLGLLQSLSTRQKRRFSLGQLG